MSTPIKFVDEQWEKWKEENSKIVHIDTEELKTNLCTDLTYASKMDVREYTLYQNGVRCMRSIQPKKFPLFLVKNGRWFIQNRKN
jgi:hypothetical protein